MADVEVIVSRAGAHRSARGHEGEGLDSRHSQEISQGAGQGERADRERRARKGGQNGGLLVRLASVHTVAAPASIEQQPHRPLVAAVGPSKTTRRRGIG